jgi:hypothetical protein
MHDIHQDKSESEYEQMLLEVVFRIAILVLVGQRARRAVNGEDGENGKQHDNEPYDPVTSKIFLQPIIHLQSLFKPLQRPYCGFELPSTVFIVFE